MIRERVAVLLKPQEELKGGCGDVYEVGVLLPKSARVLDLLRAFFDDLTDQLDLVDLVDLGEPPSSSSLYLGL